MALRTGMIERFRAALPVLRELQKDIEWIDEAFLLEDSTEEERSQVKHLRAMASKPFDEAAWRLNRLFAPVRLKGTLFLNSAGRYQIEGTDEFFTSGDSCEVFLPFYEGDEEYYAWIPTAIEYDKGYYFTARPDAPLLRALVRIRG